MTPTTTVISTADRRIGRKRPTISTADRVIKPAPRIVPPRIIGDRAWKP